jgi:hypothetical protein
MRNYQTIEYSQKTNEEDFSTKYNKLMEKYMKEKANAMRYKRNVEEEKNI